MSDRVQSVLYSYKLLAFEQLLTMAIEDDAATNKCLVERSIIVSTNRPGSSSNQPATSTPDGRLTSVRRFEEGISVNSPTQSPTYSCSLMPSSSSELDISRVQKSTTNEPETSMFQSVEVLNKEECLSIPTCPGRVSNSKPTTDDANEDNEYAIGAPGEGYCQTISRAEYERQKIFIKLQETKKILKSIVENPGLSEEYKLMMIKRCIQTNLSVAEEVMGKEYIWKLRLQMHEEEQEKKKGFLNSVKKLTKRIPSFRRK